MKSEHVYDGERCMFCNTNIYDETSYGETECVEREPITFTTDTPEEKQND